MAEQHPIEVLMTTAMESIREMVDVNTIVGDAVQSPDGTVIIPISKVSFGFAAGGGEYSYADNEGDRENRGGKEYDDEKSGEKEAKYPFAGGSGAGVSINPVAFMVVGNGQVRLLPVNINAALDKVLDLVPELLCRIEDVFRKKVSIKKSVKIDGDEKKLREHESE